MDKICFFALVLIGIVPAMIRAQVEPPPLDRYIADGKIIVVAKCLSVGPVNILLKSDYEVQVMFVVKGKETPGKLWVSSETVLIPGRLYLLRTTTETTAERNLFRITEAGSAILLSRYTRLEQLSNLPPRTIVLAAMNERVMEIEAEVERLSAELKALKTVRVEK